MADTLLLKKGELVLKDGKLVKYKTDCSCCPPVCSGGKCGICKLWITSIECQLCGDGYNHMELGIYLNFQESGKGLQCDDYWTSSEYMRVQQAWSIEGCRKGTQVPNGANKIYSPLAAFYATEANTASKQYCDRNEKKSNFWIQLRTDGEPSMKTRATGSGSIEFTMYTGNCNYYNNHGSNAFKVRVNMKIEAAKGRTIDVGGSSVSGGSTSITSGWHNNGRNVSTGSWSHSITIT